MRSYYEKSSLEDVAIAAIEVARCLEAAFDEATVDPGHDRVRFRKMFEAFRSGDLYRDSEGAALEALRSRVLGFLSSRVPGYREIALNHCTDSYYFLDPELEAARRLWEELRRFMGLRLRVIDEVVAERQLSALRRRPCATAAE